MYENGLNDDFVSSGYPWLFQFLLRNICCGYSLKEPPRGASNEYPQHTFLPHRCASNEYLYVFMMNWRKLFHNYVVC